MTADRRRYRVLFRCEHCGAPPDAATQRTLEGNLRDRQMGAYLDAQPGGWLIWTAGGPLGSKRYACAQHRDELTSDLRAHYGAIHSGVWRTEPYPAVWPDPSQGIDGREPDELPAPDRCALPSAPGFAAVARSRDASIDRLLLALAAEFHHVDSAAALEQLDDLSRELFGISRPHARFTAERIAAMLWVEVGIRPSRAINGLFLDQVLCQRRGDPALLAALYIEVARRAGVSLCLLSSGPRWVVGLLGDHGVFTIDPASPTDVRSPKDLLSLRGHCPHELADAVLCELTRRFRSSGRVQEARRAVELRLLLPLTETVLARAREELRAFDAVE